MKKKIIKLSVLVVFLFTVLVSASAQIYVSVRPPVPVIVRPPQPSPTYVWVHEEWEPNGGSYRYSGGHWVAPPTPGYYRTPGHWKQGKHGQYWVKGNWGKQHGKKGKHKKH